MDEVPVEPMGHHKAAAVRADCSSHCRIIRAMVDTGATKPIFAATPGAPSPTSGHAVINVTDAQWSTFSACGGHALWALLQSRFGPITKMLATSAFASTSMPESLMSYPALRGSYRG
jgi:hypothetical protein